MEEYDEEDETYLHYEYRLVSLAQECRKDEFKAWIKDAEKEYFFKDLLQNLITQVRFMDREDLALFLIERLELIE